MSPREWEVPASELRKCMMTGHCSSPLARVGSQSRRSRPRLSQAAFGGPTIDRLEITILSTMLADPGLGEWGFGAQ
jgi:hypothetical protein